MDSKNNNILEMKQINKGFNGVPVLKNMDFSLEKGEVHALLGGNGAGKSTLMKILNGVYTKDSGEILIDGEPVNISTADDAQKAGVSMIFQEFSLLPTMTVAQNIFIKRESTKGFLLDAKADDKKAEKLLEMLSIGHIKPTTVVSQLSVGYQQMVEIAKALSKEAKILVMDEPTASLSQSETETLFRLIDELKKSGLSIIYISHRMEEVFAICDRVTVLRDGKNVLTSPVGEVTMDEVISKMLNVESQKKAIHNSRVYTYDKEPILEVENFSYPNRLDNISFKLYPGEILGIAGLMASGRTEIVESIFGIRKKWTGSIKLDGKPITSKKMAINSGIALVPENRRKEGLVLQHSIQSNFMLPNLDEMRNGLFVDYPKGKEVSEKYIEEIGIKCKGVKQLASLLSGGNQQKIVLGKWLAKGPRVLLLDDPTIGVDIGAKREIIDIIKKLADAGMAVLLISSELIELVSACDRVLVLYNHNLITELMGSEIQSEEVLHHAIQGII